MHFFLKNTPKSFALFMLVILFLIAGCNENKIPDDKDLQQTLTDISKGRLKFYNNGDSSDWINHTTENFISINDDGSTETKNDLYNDVRNSPAHPGFTDEFGEYKNVKLYRTGNTAVLTFRITEVETFPNDTIYSPLQRTEIYNYVDGRWQIVACQVTPVPENHAAYLPTYPARMMRDTGVYLWYAGKADTISVSGNKFYTHLTGSPKEQLFAVDDSVTILKDVLGKAIFHHDANGKAISYQYLTADGQSLTAKKIR